MQRSTQLFTRRFAGAKGRRNEKQGEREFDRERLKEDRERE